MFIRFQEAEDDCTEALNLDDRYIKAYSRRATARKELGKLKESIEGMLKPYYDFISWYTYMVYILIYCTFDLSDVMNIANCRCGVCSEVGASQPRNQETVCWGQIFLWESEKFLHISEIADFNVFFSAISVPKSTNLLKSYPPAYENFYSFNCIQLKISYAAG